MLWVYPNLTGKQYKKALDMAFWMFITTSLMLLAAIVGIKAGAISIQLAEMFRQIIGPAVAINLVTLVYLADQNRKAVLEDK